MNCFNILEHIYNSAMAQINGEEPPENLESNSN